MPGQYNGDLILDTSTANINDDLYNRITVSIPLCSVAIHKAMLVITHFFFHI